MTAQEIQIVSLLEKAFNQPVSYFVLSKQETDDLVQRRIDRLRPVTKGDAPEDIKTAFEATISAISTYHKLAGEFVENANFNLPEATPVSLYKLAGLVITKGAGAISTGDQQLDRQAAARIDELVTAIIQSIDASDKRTLNDVVEALFEGRSDTEKFDAQLKAVNLHFWTDNLAAQLLALKSLSFIGLICRGILYRTIIGENGLQFGKSIRRDVLKELAVEGISMISMADWVVRILKIIDLTTQLGAEEEVLNGQQTKLASSQRNFIHTYTLLLLVWFEWAKNILHLQNETLTMFTTTLTEPPTESKISQIKRELGL
jgi:hypothetical protein